MALASVALCFLVDVASALFFDKHHEPVHIIQKMPYPVEKIVPIKVPYPVHIPMPPRTIYKKIAIKVPVKVPVKVRGKRDKTVDLMVQN